jgi:8-amino-7-oxononanoate synthase
MVFEHRDLPALGSMLQSAPRPSWIVTESYFSMDGTSPDLAALRRLCDQSGAFLVVDEAHALGVFGSAGRGLCDAAGIRPDVLIGTFGKAFGVQGAFVAGSQALRAFLWNRARSFVFSTATSPALAHTLLERLPLVVEAAPERVRLDDHSAALSAAVARLGLVAPPGRHGPIFPVLLGDPVAAAQAADRFADLGILAPAIRPPTVPDGSSRLRITLSAAHSDQDVSRATQALAAILTP